MEQGIGKKFKLHLVLEDKGDHGTAKTTSFSQLLLYGDGDGGGGGGGDDDILGLGLAKGFKYVFSCFPSDLKTPKMLCFGDHQTDYVELMVDQSAVNTTKTAMTHNKSTGSSSASSVKAPLNSNRKRNGGREQLTDGIVAAQAACRRTNKKSKVENLATKTGHAKARKEKLGDRISSLQQLVSPYGKTDTASVLHEAMGYIRFLHGQVHALCSPYLQQHLHDGGGNDQELSKALKSKGLCLVPVACIMHVVNSNGADLWSSAVMVDNEIEL